MKKSAYIAIAVIIVILVIITALIVWSYGQPTASITLYSKGEKVDNTGFYFAGFTYTEPPFATPTPGASPLPTPTSHHVLTVVFKPTSKYAPNPYHFPSIALEPSEDEIGLNSNGNTTFYLNSEYMTIVSYNVAQQAILIVFDFNSY